MKRRLAAGLAVLASMSMVTTAGCAVDSATQTNATANQKVTVACGAMEEVCDAFGCELMLVETVISQRESGE